MTAEGSESIDFALDGAPEGVSITSGSGLLIVADTVEAGEYEFNIIASDADENTELATPSETEEIVTPGTQSFTLTVEPGDVPEVEPGDGLEAELGGELDAEPILLGVPITPYAVGANEEPELLQFAEEQDEKFANNIKVTAELRGGAYSYDFFVWFYVTGDAKDSGYLKIWVTSDTLEANGIDFHLFRGNDENLPITLFVESGKHYVGYIDPELASNRPRAWRDNETWYYMDVTDLILWAEFVPLEMVIGRVELDKNILSSDGGQVSVTVYGNNLHWAESVKVGAFDGSTLIAESNITAPNWSANLTLPPNTSDTDKVYTIKVSLDGGSSWEEFENVTVRKVSFDCMVTASNGQTTNYNDLGDALDALRNGGTLTLLNDVSYDDYVNLSIYNNITIDLNGYTLDIETDRSTAFYFDEVQNPTIKGPGIMNVTSKASYGRGMYFKGSAKTDLKIINGAIINLYGSDIGLDIDYNASVILEEGSQLHASGGKYGIMCYGTNSKVDITSVTSDNIGVYIYWLSPFTVTVYDKINVPDNGTYIEFNKTGDITDLKKEDGTPSDIKPGFHEYTDGASIVYVNETLAITLSSIAITTPPTKTTYTQGDALNLSGMTVTATYSDNSTKTVTGYTADPENGAALDTAETQTVTVSYTENGVTKTVSFTVTVTKTEDVCEIVETREKYTSLDDALEAVLSNTPTTIKLLANIENDRIAINNKKITLDLNGMTLNINHDNISYNALSISNNGELYTTGAGALNIVSDGNGLGVGNNCKATITGNINANGDTMVRANPGSEVIINGNVTGTGNVTADWGSLTINGNVTISGSHCNIHSNGTDARVYINGNAVRMGDSYYTTVVCDSGGYLEITGDVTANELTYVSDSVIVCGYYTSKVIIGGNIVTSVSGVYVSNGGDVTVGGNINATLGTGAEVYVVGQITVDGKITAPRNLRVTGYNDPLPDEHDGESLKPGYYQYHIGDAYIWVKILDSIVELTSISVTTPPAKTTYTQGDALNLSGMAVTATYSDNSTKPVTGYVTTPSDGAALNTVGTQTVTVSYTEGGVTKTATFTVTVNTKSEYACEINGTGYLTLDAALAVVPNNTQTVIKLLKNISIVGTASLAYQYTFTNKKITFDLNGFNLSIISNVGYGFDVNGSAIDYIGAGEFTLNTRYTALNVRNGGSCKLTGVRNSSSNYYAVVVQGNGSSITVNGNVDGPMSDAGCVHAQSGTTVTINGNANGSKGILAENANVTITGNVSSSIDTVVCNGGTVNIYGNAITSSYTTEGVLVSGGGTVTVDGEIIPDQYNSNPDAKLFIRINGIKVTREQYAATTTKNGYLTYTDGNSTVWLKDNGTTPPEPTYTVTIPTTLDLAVGDNYLPVTVSNTQDLGGKAVAITFEATQDNANNGSGLYYRMCLWPNGISGETSVIYKLFNAENSEIISNAANPAGQILVDLNGNGTKKIRINLPEPNAGILPNVPYTGYIIFGIKLV